MSFDCKKVLITGACGFIGSHLVARMLQENANVYAFIKSESDIWRLKEVINDLRVFHVDLRNPKEINKHLLQVKPDYVFHTAAYGVDSRQNNPFAAAETNIMGTLNLIESIAGVGCAKFINIGSGAEYGRKSGLIREESPLDPVNIYGSTKAAATIIAHQLARRYSLDIVTLRAFSIFGEKEAGYRFFPYIILSLIKNKEPNLTGCIQYRDYSYVKNLIGGLILAATSDLKNEILNFASGAVHQLKYYVDAIYKLMNPDKKPSFGAALYRANELWKVEPDISRIRELLNWEPKISFFEGLEETICWYQQNAKRYL